MWMLATHTRVYLLLFCSFLFLGWGETESPGTAAANGPIVPHNDGKMNE
jgi:hypothetical protein